MKERSQTKLKTIPQLKYHLKINNKLLNYIEGKKAFKFKQVKNKIFFKQAIPSLVILKQN